MTCIYDKVIGVKLNSEERKWTDVTYISFKEKDDSIFNYCIFIYIEETNSQNRGIPLDIEISFCEQKKD